MKLFNFLKDKEKYSRNKHLYTLERVYRILNSNLNISEYNLVEKEMAEIFVLLIEEIQKLKLEIEQLKKCKNLH